MPSDCLLAASLYGLLVQRNERFLEILTCLVQDMGGTPVDDTYITVGPDENVVWFQVPVDHAAAVGVRYDIANADEQFHGPVQSPFFFLSVSDTFPDVSHGSVWEQQRRVK